MANKFKVGDRVVVNKPYFPTGTSYWVLALIDRQAVGTIRSLELRHVPYKYAIAWDGMLAHTIGYIALWADDELLHHKRKIIVLDEV